MIRGHRAYAIQAMVRQKNASSSHDSEHGAIAPTFLARWCGRIGSTQLKDLNSLYRICRTRFLTF